MCFSNPQLIFSLFAGFLAAVVWFLVSWESYAEADIAEWKHVLMALFIGVVATMFSLWLNWLIQ